VLSSGGPNHGATRLGAYLQNMNESKNSGSVNPRHATIGEPTRVHVTELQSGIRKTAEFEKKGLAQFAVNVGTKCGHGCAYCSTGALLRMHPSFKAAGENPFDLGFAIVDPDTPARVARDAARLKQRGLVQLCTTVDAWAPEAQQYGIGRKCLQAILSEPGWTVRILTKNAAVVNDFDLIDKHRDRVLVGLSLTAPRSKSSIMTAIGPNASRIEERMAVLAEAHRRGLRTYGMLCPLLPGISDAPGDIDELIRFVLSCGAEEVFVEPVNSRGPGLTMTQEVLRKRGFSAEARCIEAIRNGVRWSAYARRLLENVQSALERHQSLSKLRFLLYPIRLTPEDGLWIRAHPDGVKWLGKLT
jgi:DNA repair photolyase